MTNADKRRALTEIKQFIAEQSTYTDRAILRYLGWSKVVYKNSRYASYTWRDPQGNLHDFEYSEPSFDDADTAALHLLPPKPYWVTIIRDEAGLWHAEINTVSSRLLDIMRGKGATIAAAIVDAFIDHEWRILEHDERADAAIVGFNNEGTGE
jgi:hypothetical protein